MIESCIKGRANLVISTYTSLSSLHQALEDAGADGDEAASAASEDEAASAAESASSVHDSDTTLVLGASPPRFSDSEDESKMVPAVPPRPAGDASSDSDSDVPNVPAGSNGAIHGDLNLGHLKLPCPPPPRDELHEDFITPPKRSSVAALSDLSSAPKKAKVMRKDNSHAESDLESWPHLFLRNGLTIALNNV